MGHVTSHRRIVDQAKWLVEDLVERTMTLGSLTRFRSQPELIGVQADRLTVNHKLAHSHLS